MSASEGEGKLEDVSSLRILIAIPAYRCAAQIPRVLSALSRLKPELPEIARVIVFDNRSPDGTADEAREWIRANGAAPWMEIRVNEENLGLGGTQKKAFDLARAEGYSHVLIFHGDDQADARDVPAVVAALAEGQDAALGARFMTGSRLEGYSRLRRVGNRALNLAYGLLTGVPVRDLGSGLNGFRTDALEPAIYSRFSNQFTFNMDLLLDLIARGAKIRFIPIAWRETDQVSNARTFAVGWKALTTLLRWRLGGTP